MGRLVMKFGGTSVANVEQIRNVAQHIKREVDAGHEVAVVVSAMAGKTNELVAWATEASPLHDAREYDTIVASGEQVTSGLLAIALQTIGVPARSWQGWQIPIKTSNAHGAARISSIDGGEIVRRFKDRKEVAVISGFQGISEETGRITTLGRGGSDTSAVAIADSAIPPSDCLAMATTRRPTQFSAPSPADSTTPHTSIPNVKGGWAMTLATPPRQRAMSPKLSEAADTATRTSPGPASGTGTSMTSMASAGRPWRTTRTALTAPPSRAWDAHGTKEPCLCQPAGSGADRPAATMATRLATNAS